MKKSILALGMMTSFLLADGAALYKPCIACHGAKAEKVALGKSKVLASLSVEEIISTMKGYKDGSYGGQMKAVMAPHAKKLNDAQIETLANYIQTIK